VTLRKAPGHRRDPLLAGHRRGSCNRLVRPLRQRFALTLRYGAGLSYQEIADTLGITRTNVGVLLLRGRRRMRDRLADEGIE